MIAQEKERSQSMINVALLWYFELQEHAVLFACHDILDEKLRSKLREANTKIADLNNTVKEHKINWGIWKRKLSIKIMIINNFNVQL